MRAFPFACAAALAAQAAFSHAADPVRGKGVFGRKAGAVQDYDYSDALKKSRVIWSEKTLDRWLANPEKLIPGQKMGFTVPQAADRADIIEYLRTAR